MAAAPLVWSAWTETTVGDFRVLVATILSDVDDTTVYSNTFELDTTKLALLSINSATLSDTITFTLQYSFDTGSTWCDVPTSYFTTGAIAAGAIANGYVIVPQNFQAPLYRLAADPGASVGAGVTVTVRITQKST